MFKKYLKPVLAGLVVLVTIAVFAYYISHHPELLTQLKQTPPGLIALLLGLYVLFMICLAWIQRATLELCNVRLGRKESTLLMMYSSIINFFGPLQSGPAFRAAYLKKKHDVSLKQYTLATLLYYGFYALFSVLCIATYFVGLWALLLVVLAVALAPIVLRRFPQIVPAKFRSLKLEPIRHLALATLAQICTLAVIFYAELRSLDYHVDKVASLIYAGTANLALFVSFTPGAIGFREAFLVFTQGLHQLSNTIIIGANLIDRSVYIVFMALLALIVFGLHADSYLKKK